MTALEVFEEMRFVWELIAAEFLFLIPFAKKRTTFIQYLLLGIGAFSLISTGYFLIKKLDIWLPSVVFQCVVCIWYIFLALSTMLYLKICFQLTIHNALYMCISGYAAQHMLYIVVHEVLALGVWQEVTENLILYAAVSLLIGFLIYGLLYFFFSPKLSLCGGQMFEGTPVIILINIVLIAILMCCTFTCQYIFQTGEAVRYFGAGVDFFFCIVILGIQYLSLSMALNSKEQAIIQQILRDSEQHFHYSRELIDLVNRSCHDLKHQIHALKVMGETERQNFFKETEHNLLQYQQLIYSENEVLNTILAEKSLYCESQQINLSCSVDNVDLQFLSTPDLYTLLGNAIDNAIECVNHFAEPEKRVISLTIQSRYSFVSIQTNNYCEKEIRLREGLPITTKADYSRHGYGLKSIRYLAQKYGGSMCVDVKDNVFTLQVMLPVKE